MASVRATAELLQVAAKFIKESFKMIQCMDLDSLFGLMGGFMKENGKEIRNKVSEIIFGPMVKFMMESFARINAPDLELCFIQMESTMQVIGRKVRSMVQASMFSRMGPALSASTEMEKKYRRVDY